MINRKQKVTLDKMVRKTVLGAIDTIEDIVTIKDVLMTRKEFYASDASLLKEAVLVYLKRHLDLLPEDVTFSKCGSDYKISFESYTALVQINAKDEISINLGYDKLSRERMFRRFIMMQDRSLRKSDIKCVANNEGYITNVLIGNSNGVVRYIKDKVLIKFSEQCIFEFKIKHRFRINERGRVISLA